MSSETTVVEPRYLELPTLLNLIIPLWKYFSVISHWLYCAPRHVKLNSFPLRVSVSGVQLFSRMLEFETYRGNS